MSSALAIDSDLTSIARRANTAHGNAREAAAQAVELLFHIIIKRAVIHAGKFLQVLCFRR